MIASTNDRGRGGSAIAVVGALWAISNREGLAPENEQHRPIETPERTEVEVGGIEKSTQDMLERRRQVIGPWFRPSALRLERRGNHVLTARVRPCTDP